jgi:hypothetical protein
MNSTTRPRKLERAMTSQWFKEQREKRQDARWERIIHLARLIDRDAGADEVYAGDVLGGIINGAPVELRRHMIRLASDIDSMRAARRMMH